MPESPGSVYGKRSEFPEALNPPSVTNLRLEPAGHLAVPGFD